MFECTRCRHRKGALSCEPEFEFVGPRIGRQERHHIRGLSDLCPVCHCLTFFVQPGAEDRARGVSLFEFHGIPPPPLPPSTLQQRSGLTPCEEPEEQNPLACGMVKRRAKDPATDASCNLSPRELELLIRFLEKQLQNPLKPTEKREPHVVRHLLLLQQSSQRHRPADSSDSSESSAQSSIRMDLRATVKEKAHLLKKLAEVQSRLEGLAQLVRPAQEQSSGEQLEEKKLQDATDMRSKRKETKERSPKEQKKILKVPARVRGSSSDCR